jgi:hypothetical protein
MFDGFHLRASSRKLIEVLGLDANVVQISAESAVNVIAHVKHEQPIFVDHSNAVRSAKAKMEDASRAVR